MNKNIEIEFKTVIPEEKYLHLLGLFNLENNIFKQTNHYFDTDDYDLNARQIVLRIREKSANRFKVTLKSQSEEGAYESHVLISPDRAKHMIENGFETKEFFSDTDHFVTFKVSLDDYRVSTPYKSGTLFLDKCVYCGTTDYEIEYEVDDYAEGLVVFKQFLAEHDIRFLPTKRKSERAFTCKR
jgi:uncharacterized protein YjbK